MKTEEKKAGHYRFWRPKDGIMRGMEIEADRAILSADNIALGVLYGEGVPTLREEQEYLIAAANACREAGIPTEALENGVVGEMLIASECAIAQFEFVARAIDEINQPAWKDIADGCRKQASVIRAVLAKAKGE